MSSTKFLLKQIADMNVSSEDFFEVYKSVSDKYWTFEKPDDEQMARRTLHLITEKGEPEDVMLLVHLFKELLKISEKGGTVAVEMGFKEKTFYFKISDSPDGLDNLKKQLTNTVMVKAREQEGV